MTLPLYDQATEPENFVLAEEPEVYINDGPAEPAMLSPEDEARIDEIRDMENASIVYALGGTALLGASIYFKRKGIEFNDNSIDYLYGVGIGVLAISTGNLISSMFRIGRIKSRAKKNNPTA